MTPSQYALDWWKGRHDIGYFPTMEPHLNWRVYPCMPDWFLEHARPDGDIALEIGCGYGQWIVPLSRLVCFVAGIDVHPILQIKANEKFVEAGVTNAQFLLGDGLSIPTEDNCFNLVYSISVFQHMPRETVRSYLAETHRVLVPGGRTIMHFRAADGKGSYADDISVGHKGDWSVGWTREQVQEAGEGAGLTNCEVIDLGDVLLLKSYK